MNCRQGVWSVTDSWYNTFKGERRSSRSLRTNPTRKAKTTGSSNRHKRDWEIINIWVSPKKNKQTVIKLNTYTRAGRCGSAWVATRLLQEYRASFDSQTSGRCVRPKFNQSIVWRQGRETGSRVVILEELMSSSSLNQLFAVCDRHQSLAANFCF